VCVCVCVCVGVEYTHLVQTWDSVVSSCEHVNEIGTVKFWNIFD